MPSSSTSRPTDRTGAAVALFAALLIAPAAAQYDEDTLDPAEIGIRDIEAVIVPRTGYVGNEACASCHASAYDKWLGTPHSRTFVPMRSTMAMTIGEKEGITALYPAKSGICLQCHGTAHNVPAAYRAPGVRMGEGVTCERCHGPGQDHAELAVAQKRRRRWNVKELRRALDEPVPCLSCHVEKKSHEVLLRPHTDPTEARKRIAHPAPPSEKAH